MILNQLISSLLQILAFTLIPFTVYVITNKGIKGFRNYLGIIPTTKKALILGSITSIVFVMGGIFMALLSADIREILINPPSITGMIRQLGMNASSLSILLIIALVKTSLSEEILFRGFIAKRLIAKLGFLTGNIIQALIFASVHVIVFWAVAHSNPSFLVFIFILSGTAGFLIEVINEKYGNGSIIPGWIAHGVGNTISYFILAFIV